MLISSFVSVNNQMEYKAFVDSRTADLQKKLEGTGTKQLLAFPADIGQTGQEHFVFFRIKVPKASRYFGQNNGASPIDKGASSQTAAGKTAAGKTDAQLGMTSKSWQGGYSESFIDQSIALYMPNDGIKNVDSQQWETMSFGQFQTNADNIMTAAAGRMNTTEYGQALKELALNSTNSVASALGVPLKEFMEKRGNYVLNPHIEVLYKGVHHREHQFTFVMMAKSRADTLAIREIVRTFRYHQASEFTGVGNGFFIYPSVFDIGFFTGNTINPHLPKFGTCALRQTSVRWHGGDSYRTFTNGAPLIVHLDLQFQELEIVTKEKIAQGF